MLNEGIDVPAVEAVALIEPRRAQHELLQIAGRALRFDRGNPEKTASIIVPVLHLEGPADEEMASADWDPVTNVLRAVESYEPDGGAEATQSTSRTPHSVLTDAEERRRQQERARELTQMLKLTRERSQRAVVDWLRITVVGDPSSGDLEKVMQAATAYQSLHGNLKVPADWEEDGVRLGVELDKLRRKARADKGDLERLVEELGDAVAARSTWMEHGPRVHPDLVQYLADLGFEWEPAGERTGPAAGRRPGLRRKATGTCSPAWTRASASTARRWPWARCWRSGVGPGSPIPSWRRSGCGGFPRRCRGRLPSTVSSCG
ncbi:hypothetical protein [Streptomyces noursei]|uniref:helicase associated domain-containing protein n=1 Tax=Streptomyces noursei TaxID=1971 RepID=UPI003DA52AF8